MNATVTDYDAQRNAISVRCDGIPSAIRVFKPDKRGRSVYTSRTYEYVPKHQLEQLEEKLEEYDNYIQWLCQYVPEDRWDEVYDQITKMGIDYIGADDV